LDDFPGHLVAEDHGRRGAELIIGDVNVRAADAGCPYPDHDRARAGGGLRPFPEIHVALAWGELRQCKHGFTLFR
jgi:hypothetical protein